MTAPTAGSEPRAVRAFSELGTTTPGAPDRPTASFWAPPKVDLRSPPATLEEMTDWFEAISTGLVLLEPYRLEEVREAIDRFEEALSLHLRAAPTLEVRASCEGARARTLGDLRADHARFRVSIEQLDWFFGIVESEDHGGHRQALGQYGRLVTEALRRHLSDERSGRLPAAASAKG